jgi:hypothetical protein
LLTLLISQHALDDDRLRAALSDMRSDVRNASDQHMLEEIATSVPFNLETAVAGSAKRQKASIGAALRQISGTAEQFQMVDRRPTGIIRRNSNLASFGDANWSF